MTDAAAEPGADAPFTPEQEARIRELIREETTVDVGAIAAGIRRSMGELEARQKARRFARLPHAAE